MSAAPFDVQWTDTAQHDLTSIVRHIAADDVAAARGVADRLRRKAANLTAFPSRGRIVPELKTVGVLQYRELIERPWRIVYRIERDAVFVIAVLDSRRDMETVLLERLVRTT